MKLLIVLISLLIPVWAKANPPQPKTVKKTHIITIKFKVNINRANNPPPKFNLKLAQKENRM